MFPHIHDLRTWWLGAVLGAVFVTGTLAGEPADPFGPGPGPSAAGADPFGAKSGAAAKTDDARRRATQAAVLIDQAVHIVEQDLLAASDDALVLDDALWLLNHQAGDAWNIVAKLAGQRWGRDEGEPVREFVARLDARVQRRSDELKTRLEQIRSDVEKLQPPGLPLDWRQRQTAWLEFVELIILTKSGEDVAGRWQQAAAAQPDLTHLYRMAYLRSVRQSPTGGFDDAFVRPLLAAARPGPQRIRAAAELLTTLLAQDVPDAHPLRIEARTKLLDELRASSAPWEFPGYALAQPLAELYRAARAQSAAEAVELLDTILSHRQPHFFVTFSGWAGIPPAVQQQLLLAKPVQVTAAHNTLGKALPYLASQTAIPVWIDSELGRQGRGDLPVATCDGPWLPILEKVLSGTGCGLYLLGPDLFWIGPPDRLGAARKGYLDGLAKSRWASAKPQAALSDETRLEFIETPLEQVADFLSDMHNIPVRVAESHRQDAVTLSLRGITYDQALDVLCLKLGLKWDVDGKAISIAGR